MRMPRMGDITDASTTLRKSSWPFVAAEVFPPAIATG